MKLHVAKPISIIDNSNIDPPEPRQGFVPIADSENESNVVAIDQDIRELILEDAKTEGCIRGAVVVHKRTLLAKRIDVTHWGIILYHHPTNENTSSIWKPVRVKWLSGEYENCHVQDLCVLIYVPTTEILKGRAARYDKEPSPI